MKIDRNIWLTWALLCSVCILTLNACRQSGPTPTITAPPSTPTRIFPDRELGLSPDQILTLESLEIVDDYPLYVMHYYADYESTALNPNVGADEQKKPDLQVGYQDLRDSWGCSLFAAFGDSVHPLFGRNFDWQYSPAVLLYVHPKAGNASISMVDIQYLVGNNTAHLHELPLEKRLPLLAAPHWPFDGMNDCGLAIGMAAVPTGGEIQSDPQKTDIDSLEIMREILDHACTVDEAVELMNAHNILWEGGPELHYLIAETSGRSVLVEYYRGKMTIIPNQDPWHQATNFLLSSTDDTAQGVCSRYDTITATMQASSGRLSTQQAMSLLSQVSQDSTQWSAVYDIKNGEIQVVMGREYENPLAFRLDMSR